MAKLKIEMSLKLRQEENRGKSYNIINNGQNEEKVWLKAFGT